VMLLGGPGAALLHGLLAGALGCFGTAVQEHEFSRANARQVRGQACKSYSSNSALNDSRREPVGSDIIPS
jgi:hypothetical protein